MWNPFRRRGKEQPPQQPAGGVPAPPSAPTPEEKRPRLLRRLTGRLRPKPPKEEAAPPAPPEAPPQKQYPNRIGVTADGVWQISDTEWDGIMHGTLHGDDVVAFLDAIEAGDLATAAGLVAMAYDETVASLIDTHRSEIRHIGY